MHDPVQIARQGAHTGRNGHLVVIQNHQQLFLELAQIVDSLQGDAARQTGITDHGDDVEIVALEVARDRHT